MRALAAWSKIRELPIKKRVSLLIGRCSVCTAFATFGSHLVTTESPALRPPTSHQRDRSGLMPDPERPPIDLLRPFDAKKMIAWKVGKAVGNVKNDRNRLPYECYRGHLSLGRRIHTIRRCGSSNRILPGVVRRPSLLLGVRITVMRLSAPPKRS